VIFFTSDIHFNHTNIIKFCDRPFKNIEQMNERIIQNINARCSAEDTLYHIGDFMFRGGHQGGKLSAAYFENQINPKIVHILGNHDRNNRLKNNIRYAEIWFANRRWVLQHKPPEETQLRIFPTQAGEAEVYLVGHVHTSWKYKWIEGRLVINVGIDVWNMFPVTQQEIIVYADRCRKENGN
jgi:calcineurin-like phosphoesterase family protein